ncbi:MAG: o-succinylbenzoate--CoA ligase [Chloroflexi bacterium]|nr:o-succinylbenzoate--CoA ligase [Chloroflexota bacterium]
MPFLAARAAQTPDAPALEFTEERWNYESLNSWAESIAAHLESKVQRGARVAIHLSIQPAYVALIHALARIGAVAVPLNTRLTESEIKWQIEQSQCNFTIHANHSTPQPFILHSAFSIQHLNPDSVQGIFFTSGTTGFPKGAMLTLGNHHASALASADRLPAQKNDRWLLTMPLYHIGGMSIVFRAAIYGIEIVLHSGFDVDKVHHALTDENITHISLVPTMLHRLLEKYPNFKPSPSLRVILLGGAGAPESLVKKALALNLPIALTYGLTEAASQVATSTPEQTRAKPGSVGKPLSGTTVNIVDETGKSLPNGEVGEIVVSGKTVMQGYLHDRPDRFSRSPRRGKPVRSINTGDIGYLDSDGDLWVLTRRTDLIVCGGENIYPEEVERALTSHPAVSEACVVGLPDQAWGQSVAAAVVASETVSEENLIQFLRGLIAGFKIPKQIIFVESLPHTASGKLKRAEVKDLTGFRIALINQTDSESQASRLTNI